MTYQGPRQLIYDRIHDKFFVSVPDTNELLTIATDGTVLARTNMIHPQGLDLSPDGKLLYVTSVPTIFGLATLDGFYIVDAATSQVVDLRRPVVISGSDYSAPGSIAVMENGKIFYAGIDPFVTDAVLFQYDPVTNLASQVPVPKYGSLGAWFLGKSGNGKRLALLSVNHISIYDSDSDSFIANLQLNVEVYNGVAVNWDGSKIFVGGALYDGDLNKIAGPIPAEGFFAFSPDGSILYQSIERHPSVNGPISAIAVYDSTVLKTIGFVPSAPQPAQLAANGDGVALIRCDRGVERLELRQPHSTLLPVFRFGASDDTGAVVNTANTTITYDSVDGNLSTIYFGSEPAKTVSVHNGPSGGSLAVTPPSPKAPGPVDLSALRSDGWAGLLPVAYSYGPAFGFQDSRPEPTPARRW